MNKRILDTMNETVKKDCDNVLIKLLPDEQRRALLARMERIETPFGMKLYERDEPLEWAYFPCSGEHSILAIMEDGNRVEVGTVGREGMSSVDLLVGGAVALETTVCQIPGEALRMPAGDFLKALTDMPALADISRRYLQAYLSQVQQSVACNRLHNLEQRFARWVLMSHDRVHGDSFYLTQDYLAAMLGVQRPSVSVVAQGFQQAGHIKYARGEMTVLDRAGLEAAACECYQVTRQRYRNLLGTDTG